MPFYLEYKKQKRKDEDELAWLHGVYTVRGISTIGKGKFPDKPLDLYGVARNTVEDEEGETKEQIKDAVDFGAWAMAFNKQAFGTTSLKESEVREDGE